MHQSFEEKCNELEEKIRILEEENEHLSERAEESLLLGLVSASIQNVDDRDELIEKVLERCSILKSIPYCACYSINKNSTELIAAYTLLSDDSAAGVQITLSPSILRELDIGPYIISSRIHESEDLSINSQYANFVPNTLAFVPFETRPIPKGIFVFIDNDLTEDRLSPMINLLQQVVDITTARIDKISLINELIKINAELDQRVEERTKELRGSNKKLQNEIIERQQVERALRESEKKYQDLYDNAPDMFVSVDAKTATILEYNQTMANTLGYTKEELINRPIFDIYTTDSAEYAKTNVFPGFVETGTIREQELKLQRKDGSTIDASLNVSAVYDNNGNVLYSRSSLRDISDKKKLESQLQQAHKMEAIGTLAGGIAHDFNNILSIIVGNTELAIDDVPEWNPARINLEEIRTASLRAKDVVRQLLSFARKTELKKKPINIIPIIKESLKLLRSSIPTSVEIRSKIAKNVNIIMADPTQINQILLNLCTNADHAMPDGGVIEVILKNLEFDEDTATQYTGLSPGRYVSLSVSDTGHGISKEEIDRIFDPYFTTKEVGKGTGMGLAVVHGIVNGHNGKIVVESEIRKGTNFTIFFPVVKKDAVVEIETVDKIPVGNESILFVDDEKSIVEITRQMLERLGYHVESRMNPIEALELFKPKPDQFDLVITDMTMPQMSGVKLSEELKAVRSDIPIIISTGYSSLIDEEKSKKLGIDAYIMKPIVLKDIAKTIREVLDQAKNQ